MSGRLLQSKPVHVLYETTSNQTFLKCSQKSEEAQWLVNLSLARIQIVSILQRADVSSCKQ